MRTFQFIIRTLAAGMLVYFVYKEAGLATACVSMMMFIFTECQAWKTREVDKRLEIVKALEAWMKEGEERGKQ